MALCYSCFKEYDSQFGMCPFCGAETITEPKEAVHLLPGTVLNGRYIIGVSVGEGGFGVVYNAYDKTLDRIVAIKELFSAKLVTRYPGETAVRINKKTAGEFEYRKNRFLTEARYIANFNSNKNIVGVLDHFEENNTAYIVMELLKGMSLSSYMAKHGGKLDRSLTLEIAGQICSALEELHNENIIHCDVAPDNIFVLEGHEVKLFDFGAAKLADSADAAIDICLKPGYSPPEQYDRTNNLGPWTDIYALGATLYIMLTGIKPDESTNRKLNDTVVPPHVIDPSIPDNLSNTVMKAMAVEKHLRFKNIDALRKSLIGDVKVRTLAQEKRIKNLKRVAGIATALVILASVTGAVANMYSDKKEENGLRPATVSVWYSVADGSSEQAAMESIKEDFESKFPDVTIELKAINESSYTSEISAAAKKGELPDLFESSGLSDDVLKKAQDVSAILDSPQAKECLFLEDYHSYYSDTKKIPLGIEVPVAAVITKGSTKVVYNNDVFDDLSDFRADKIAMDNGCDELIEKNLDSQWASRDTFMDNESNTSPVMMTSSMNINDIRKELVNYTKNYVFLDGDKVSCDYIYEWSIGATDAEERRASERLLSWMLGNVYQSELMITIASDGQIPVNEKCFYEKCSNKNYKGLEKAYKHYVFD